MRSKKAKFFRHHVLNIRNLKELSADYEATNQKRKVVNLGNLGGKANEIVLNTCTVVLKEDCSRFIYKRLKHIYKNKLWLGDI